MSKTQLHKIRKSGRFFGSLLGSSLKTRLPLTGNELKPLVKRVLVPLGLTVTASRADAAIHKEMLGSGCPMDLISRATTLMISNKKINDIMKIVNSLEKSSLFKKAVSETIKNKAKEQKGEFLTMLLGTLGAGLLGNL